MALPFLPYTAMVVVTVQARTEKEALSMVRRAVTATGHRTVVEDCRIAKIYQPFADKT